MVAQSIHQVRPADLKDQQPLSSLIHFETQVHRHLDWRAPLDWLGNQPFFILERKGEVVAALACPIDPPGIAWVHLFAVASHFDPYQAWQLLWRPTLDCLAAQPSITVAAITLQDWFYRILLINKFALTINVIVLRRETSASFPANLYSRVFIRPITSQDLPQIETLDNAAFRPLWRNSLESLQVAFQQSVFATVAEIDGCIVGYQISTATQMGGHLARLATHPDYRRRGVASALLKDLLCQLSRSGALYVTVNTQEDNQASILLYERFGFVRTGEIYPVVSYQE